MEKRRASFIKGSREEEKRTSFLNINGEKYRMIYSKAYGDTITKDILKIEISTNFIEIVPHIKEIVEREYFKRIHLFVKYKEFLRLEKFIERIDRELMCGGYEVNFVFIPKEYSEEEYILMYDIVKIERE